MKKILILLYLLIINIGFLFCQNVGIGTTTPTAKLHLKGSENITQLIIDANSTQSNTQPLIKLRASSGIELLHIHSDDTSNTFIGLKAGRVNNALLNALNNTFTGSYAGYSNTTGNSNTASGTNALRSNTSSSNNTAIGRDALYFNTFGSSNSAYGYGALGLNTSGSSNTAIGSLTLFSNQNGTLNTATGSSALLRNSSGNYNTASGSDALNNNIGGESNTATGYQALFSNNGSKNTGTGAQVLYSNSTGINNTASGYIALFRNTTGGYNAATGMEALYSNVSGIGNTANGFESLFSNTTGNQNTAVGYNTLADAISSSYNTALGSNAGSGTIYFMGWNNTLIGANSIVNGTDIYNTIALGVSVITTASNQARIGNSSTTSIGGYAGWTNISDGRVKKNVSDNVPGLSFINMLKPVTYNLDLDAVDRIIQAPGRKNKDGSSIPAMPFETDARKQKEQILYTGFVAQDVEKAAKELGYDFCGVDAAKNDNDLYGLRYAEFVVPLVKAVQELSKQNDELKRQQEELLKRVEKLESLLNPIK